MATMSMIIVKAIKIGHRKSPSAGVITKYNKIPDPGSNNPDSCAIVGKPKRIGLRKNT
jgi:hypothetical protein